MATGPSPVSSDGCISLPFKLSSTSINTLHDMCTLPHYIKQINKQSIYFPYDWTKGWTQALAHESKADKKWRPEIVGHKQALICVRSRCTYQTLKEPWLQVSSCSITSAANVLPVLCGYKRKPRAREAHQVQEAQFSLVSL